MAGDAPDSFAGPKPTGLAGSGGAAPVPTSELMGRRNSTSKTFATTSPGQLVSQAYSGPIQFRGTDGVMHDTDPTLVASAPGRFATKATAIGVDLASSPTDANLATVSFDATHTVSFGLTGAVPGAAASPQTVAGSSTPAVVHPGILAGVNLELKAGSGGLNETIVLTSPSAPETLAFPLHLKGLTATIDPASGDIVYTDSNGNIVGRTPHGSMADSNVDPRSGDPATSTGVTYSIAGTGADVTLTVALDHAWLTDPSRLYPVSVDPTVTPALDSSDDTYGYSPYTNNNSTDYQLKVGTWDGGQGVGQSRPGRF